MSLKSFYEQFEGRITTSPHEHVTITKQEYEEIQLYAWKEGMTKAAQIVKGEELSEFEEARTWEEAEQIAEEIENARDHTDTLWPRPMI